MNIEPGTEHERNELYRRIAICKERILLISDVNDLEGGGLVAIERGRLMLEIQEAMKELVKLIG